MALWGCQTRLVKTLVLTARILLPTLKPQGGGAGREGPPASSSSAGNVSGFPRRQAGCPDFLLTLVPGVPCRSFLLANRSLSPGAGGL